jgi:hypothetical protein
LRCRTGRERHCTGGQNKNGPHAFLPNKGRTKVAA